MIDIRSAIQAMQNLGVSLNDHDSQALEFLVQWSEDAAALLPKWVNDNMDLPTIRALEGETMRLVGRSTPSQ
jgi:hypothetical protein